MQNKMKSILDLYRKMTREQKAEYVKKNPWILEMWREYAAARDRYWERREEINDQFQAKLPENSVIVQFTYDDLGEVTGIKIVERPSDTSITILAADLEELL